MKKKVLTMLMGIGLVLVQSSCSDNYFEGLSKAENVYAVPYSATFMNNQKQALSQYRQLLGSFDDTPDKGKSMRQSKVYPESYGGAYIDDEGKLVICVTDSSANVHLYSHYVSNGIASLKAVQYSLNTLKGVMDKMNAHVKEHPEGLIAQNMDFFAIDERNNRIVFDVKQLDKGYEEQFRDLIEDTSCVALQDEAGGFEYLASTSIQRGEKLVAASTGYMFSLGIRAKLDSEEGFITTGHAPWQEGEYVKYNGDIFAKLVEHQNSGSVDAAFCEITNSDFKIHDNAGGSIATEEMNGQVVAYGYNNTAFGKIEYTNVTSGSLTNLSAFTFDIGSTLQEGDSGGGVFATGGGALGVIRGKGIEAGFTNVGIYTKASEIEDALGVTVY